MESLWTALAQAPDQLTAELWQNLLRAAGIPARLAPGDVASYLGPSPFPCRVIVPLDQAECAADALADMGVTHDFSW